MSSRVSAPPWNIDLTPFYLASPPPPKKKKFYICQIRSPSWETPWKFWRTWLSLPLKCTLIQKNKDSFSKETKDLISDNEMRAHLTLKYEFTVAKSKNHRRLRILLSISFLLSNWWDLIGIFNAENKKGVSKFSGLRWFLLFEDLDNGEGS